MKVSIVIPCYNAEQTIARCLDGLFAQTYGDLEIIAVDDGSTDGTPALLEGSIAASPVPMEVIHQTNRGACAARNAGLAKAKGTYIQFMDADDELLPEKIAHQVQLAQASKLPDLIIGSSRTYRADGTLRDTDIQHPNDRDAWWDLMRHRLGGTPPNFWKRSMMEEVGGWNEAMASSQEYDLMFRFLQHDARLVFDEVVLTVIRLQASGSVSTGKLDRTWVRFIELRARILEHIRATQPGTDLRPYHQVLFDSIRTLYAYSPEQAVAFHDQLLPRDFLPTPSPATGKGYLLLHRMLGFARANRLRRLLS